MAKQKTASKVSSKVTAKEFVPPAEAVWGIPLGFLIVTERVATTDRDEINTLEYDANELIGPKVQEALTEWLKSQGDLLPNARIHDVAAVAPIPVSYVTGLEKMIRPKPKATKEETEEAPVAQEQEAIAKPSKGGKANKAPAKQEEATPPTKPVKGGKPPKGAPKKGK